MTDPDKPTAPDAADPAEAEQEENSQWSTTLDLAGQAGADLVGELCSSALDVAGSILGGICDGL